MKFYYYSVLFALGLGMTTNAAAVDVSLSGFGTIGYAQSDQPYNYMRFINNKGTLKADSLLGAQADVKFNEHWGATFQGVVAPSIDDDNRIESRTRWAFVSYRPDNDWLIRLGKQRVGSFLNMQNMEVGTTYDMARLPIEVYSLSSVYDFIGISIAKTWHINSYDATLEAIMGKSDASLRYYLAGSMTTFFTPVDLETKGLSLTLSNDNDTYRLGYYSTAAKGTGSESQMFTSHVNVQPTPFGDLLIPTYTREAVVNVSMASASFVRGDYRLSAEYALSSFDGVDTVPEKHAAYLSVARKMGNWIPYITYARGWSTGRGVNQFHAVQSAVAPLGYKTVYQDALSSIAILDQNSWMLGAAYMLSPTQKIKAEIMQTHIGEASSLIDSSLSNQDMRIYSLSYSFAF